MGTDFGEFGIVWHLGKAGEPLLDKLWFYVASLRIKSDSSVMLERDYKSMNDAMNAGSLGGEGQKRSQNLGVVTNITDRTTLRSLVLLVFITFETAEEQNT